MSIARYATQFNLVDKWRSFEDQMKTKIFNDLKANTSTSRNESSSEPTTEPETAEEWAKHMIEEKSFLKKDVDEIIESLDLENDKYVREAGK